MPVGLLVGLPRELRGMAVTVRDGGHEGGRCITIIRIYLEYRPRTPAGILEVMDASTPETSKRFALGTLMSRLCKCIGSVATTCETLHRLKHHSHLCPIAQSDASRAPHITNPTFHTQRVPPTNKLPNIQLTLSPFTPPPFGRAGRRS